jgi:hypothetical protein
MKLKPFGFLLLSLSAFLVSAEKARFDNYRVYSIAVETREQLKVLREIEESSDSVSFETEKKINFIKRNADPNSTVSGKHQRKFHRPLI